MAKTTIPILFPAPHWTTPRSNFLVLWHGCTSLDKDKIEKNGIDLSRCAVDSDFGQGFYTTTLERQGRQWAWDRYYKWLWTNPKHRKRRSNRPVVLRFRVPRHSAAAKKVGLKKGVDELLSLAFVRGDYDNEDYWSFVQHCRQITAAAPINHKREPDGWYGSRIK